MSSFLIVDAREQGGNKLAFHLEKIIMRLIDADKLIKDGWVLTKHGASNTVTGIKSIADVPTESENSIFTDVHREYLNKQITKALKMIDYEKIVKDAVERKFDALYKVGLLNGKDESR